MSASTASWALPLPESPQLRDVLERDWSPQRKLALLSYWYGRTLNSDEADESDIEDLEVAIAHVETELRESA